MSKFWITTGLYPQELLIDLNGTKPINEVKFNVTGASPVLTIPAGVTETFRFHGRTLDKLYLVITGTSPSVTVNILKD